MEIQVERSEDYRALSDVARASFLETFADSIPAADIARRADAEDSPEGFRRALRKGAVAWLASIAETRAPVGYAMLTAPDLPDMEVHEGDLELKRIYLLHRFHGTGTGRALLEAAEIEARERGAPRLLLGVYAENPVVGWYERRGFSTVGTRAFRVGDSLFDDLLMAKSLQEA